MISFFSLFFVAVVVAFHAFFAWWIRNWVFSVNIIIIKNILEWLWEKKNVNRPTEHSLLWIQFEIYFNSPFKITELAECRMYSRLHSKNGPNYFHILWCVHIFDRNVGPFHVNFVYSIDLYREYWRLHLWLCVFFIVDCFRITYSDLTRKNNNNAPGFI